MSRTSEYVISAPTGFAAAAARFKTSLLDIGTRAMRGEIKMVDSLHEDGDKLVQLSDDQVSAFRTQHPGLVIEPNIRYKLVRQPFGAERFEEILIPAARSRTLAVQVIDSVTSAPVSGAEIIVVLDPERDLVIRGFTDGAGKLLVSVRSTTEVLPQIILLPRAGYWARRFRNVGAQGSEVLLRAAPLPAASPQVLDWGHKLTGLDAATGNEGAGIKIGVIDTGVRKDHEDIRPSGGVNCVTGEDRSLWFQDDDGHGTHCAGVIAATSNHIGVRGYVPKAELRAYRVFAKDAEGASTFDIARAIDTAVQDGCDILSMSLGSPTAQNTLRAKLEAAFERGVLCVAAAGNEGGPVGYPAAFPSVVAVSAIGMFGEYPEESLHKEAETARVSPDGKIFFASFSNSGPEIAFCAPGVAIRSTVPGGYGALDGTSMACPHISGLAALALATHPAIHRMARDGLRTETLIALLRSRATSFGLGPQLEGAGCPTVPALLVP